MEVTGPMKFPSQSDLADQDYLGYVKHHKLLVFRPPNQILEVYTSSTEVKNQIHCGYSLKMMWIYSYKCNSDSVLKIDNQKDLCLTEIL